MRFRLSLIAPAALLALSALALTMAPAAHAQTPAIDITGAGSATTSGFFTVGYRFTVTGTQTVTGLGVFDYGADGLAQAHDVGLWNNNQTLLASTTVSTANSVAIASGSTQGNWREVAVTPVTLTAGDYYVGAYYSSSNTDAFVLSAPFTSIAGFAFGSDAFVSGSQLTFPTRSTGTTASAAYVGPGVFTAGAVGSATAPEPGSLALFGLGLVGGVGSLRLRRRKTGA